jgi:hypothetical protein
MFPDLPEATARSTTCAVPEVPRGVPGASRPVSRPRGLPHRMQVRCDTTITDRVDHSTANQGMHCSRDRSDDTRSARILRHVGKPGIAIRLRVSVLVYVLVAFSLAAFWLHLASSTAHTSAAAEPRISDHHNAVRLRADTANPRTPESLKSPKPRPPRLTRGSSQ